jgi:hypothetical protein
MTLALFQFRPIPSQALASSEGVGKSLAGKNAGECEASARTAARIRRLRWTILRLSFPRRREFNEINGLDSSLRGNEKFGVRGFLIPSARFLSGQPDFPDCRRRKKAPG